MRCCASEGSIMRIVKIVAKGLPLFKDDQVELNLYTSDRVAKNEDGVKLPMSLGLGNGGSIYSQNVIGLVGVNASGKTTVLNLIDFVISYLTDRRVSRHAAYETKRLGRLAGDLMISVVFWKDGALYLLESVLRYEHTDTGGFGCVYWDDLVFADETLWRLGTIRPKRAHLDDLSEFKSNAAVVMRRNGDRSKDLSVLSDDERSFLDDHESMVSPYYRAPGHCPLAPGGHFAAYGPTRSCITRV